MRERKLGLTTIKLIKVMGDGKWYSTKYLTLVAGKTIPPEIASRVRHTIYCGRLVRIYQRLERFKNTDRIEQIHNSHYSTWRLKGGWYKKYL